MDLSNIKINDIENSNGRLYLGSFGHGLIIVDKENLKVEVLKNSFPLANLIFKVDVGMESVWTTSQYGLSSYNLKNGNVVNFSSDDMSANSFIEFEIKSLKDGTVYFGNQGQFLSFRYKTIKDFGNKPRPYIDELSSQQSIEKYWVNTQSNTEIKFKATDKDFALKLGAINYNPLSNNTYTYRLSGYDDNWYTAIEDQKIGYTNLKPGKYKFEYFVTDQYSDENAELKSLDINIGARLYEMLWFKILVFLLITGILLLLIKLRDRKKKKTQ